MLKFNGIEIINKILGVAIVAIISRVLLAEYGEYLTYQTVFGYLFMLSVFSTDYMFLVEYKADHSFLQARIFKSIMQFKAIMIALAVVILLILMPSYTTFIFWPYAFSFIVSIFSFDFVLYVKDLKVELVLLRLVSQVLTGLCVMLFYFEIWDPYYITIIQPIQTVTLVLGTYYVARKQLGKDPIPWSDMFAKGLGGRRQYLGQLVSYFSIKNFLTYILSIEVILFFYLGYSETGSLFAEGLRVTAILSPFVSFYINFNINKAKTSFYWSLLVLGVILVFLSPFYTIIFGSYFLRYVFYYNFFIIGFLYSSFLANDTLSILTELRSERRKLVGLNLVYIFSYALILGGVCVFFELGVNGFIVLFVAKLVIYYGIFGKLFKTNVPAWRILFAFVFLGVLNVGLEHLGYFEYSTGLTNQGMEFIKSIVNEG